MKKWPQSPHVIGSFGNTVARIHISTRPDPQAGQLTFLGSPSLTGGDVLSTPRLVITAWSSAMKNLGFMCYPWWNLYFLSNLSLMARSLSEVALPTPGAISAVAPNSTSSKTP